MWIFGLFEDFAPVCNINKNSKETRVFFRLQEKEEEFENTRKNFARALDSMQASLEGEVKAKEEALRIKKKIESDINEMGISLDHANKANVETAKQVKRLANSLLEIDTAVEEESRLRADIEDQAGIAERKGTQMSNMTLHFILWTFELRIILKVFKMLRYF